MAILAMMGGLRLDFANPFQFCVIWDLFFWRSLYRILLFLSSGYIWEVLFDFLIFFLCARVQRLTYLIVFCMGSIVRDFFIRKGYEFCVIMHTGHFHSYLLSTELVVTLTVFLRCCILLLCFI